jgi:tetratricopeptide (TPR) repeat protein
MSAGEFFDLVKPAFLIASAILSILVFADAQQHRWHSVAALIWSLAAFLLPLVTLPIYLLFRRHHSTKALTSISAARFIGERFLLPFFYGIAIFGFIAVAQYREYNAIDAYLARAQQAKLAGDRARTIREYRQALSLENNAHTHKLLGIELQDEGDWTNALSEFRLAESRGEIDPALFFRIATTLEQLDQPNQASVEYGKFLHSEACQLRGDARCELAKQRFSVTRNESKSINH